MGHVTISSPSASTTLTPFKPEEAVRQKAIKKLLHLGWGEGQLQWKPEWQVPKTPHDLTKRERGQKYEVCGSADLVIFADASGEAHALQIIFEFKAPDISAGKAQLMRYLSSEPMAKMGYWTNGTESLAIYKRHSADWVEAEGAALPQPGDDLSRAPDIPPSWNMIHTPSEAELSAVLRRIVATVVVSDTVVTRREDQLRELLHVTLVKLENDAIFSRSARQNDPMDFRLYGSREEHEARTAAKVRELFRGYFARQRTRIFLPHDRDELPAHRPHDLRCGLRVVAVPDPRRQDRLASQGVPNLSYVRPEEW